MISHIERAAKLGRDEPSERQLDKLEALLALATADVREAAPLIADLLSLPFGGRYPLLTLTPQEKKEKTRAALVRQLAGLAARQPILALYEDVHWADPSALDLLGLVVNRIQRLPVLVTGLVMVRDGLAAWRATEAELYMPYNLALLAEAHATAGSTAEALRLLAEALAWVERTGERWFEAEQHRLQGELLLSLPDKDYAAAEACLRQALDVSRAQSAKSWELRAATRLARLWRDQGMRADACDLLAPVYAWFTEGFDTPDLKEAKTLLEELR